MTNPELSVVIPSYNRSAIVERCVRALCAQTCAAARYEIIVSDDGSPDDTAAVVAALQQQFAGHAIVYLHQPNAGANRARNRAIGAARGGLLLFINDDTIAVPRMLEEHLAAHAEQPDDRVAVLGRMTVSPDLPPSRLAPLHLDRAFVRLRDGQMLDWRGFFTCNVSVKKSLLDRGGLFEERMRYHEDLELAWRLSAQGLRVWYRAQALGYHDHFLAEPEFFAIAAREARSLATWAKLAPQARPLLAELGFEPEVALAKRLRHHVFDAVLNPALRPLWLALARRGPERLGLALYDQLYLARKRAALRLACREP
jgi:glycosyltransferase involved in cell wall biosynthesis